ncbi:helix-turn-helix domain-containing protein [Paenibacillus sp. RS8]|uniref:helix-turn-helix domain-containing protein n=1 Tax=Paenibacillus sp. RS8 TaxID=3242681 RepID=UPI0035BFEFD8
MRVHVTRGRCLLQEWIDSRGWTQTDYAKMSGRPKRMISHFCNDERVMKPEDEYAASLIFGCKIEELHDWTVEYLKEE